MSNKQAIKANQYPGTMMQFSRLTIPSKAEQQFMIPKQPMNDKQDMIYQKQKFTQLSKGTKTKSARMKTEQPIIIANDEQEINQKQKKLMQILIKQQSMLQTLTAELTKMRTQKLQSEQNYKKRIKMLQEIISGKDAKLAAYKKFSKQIIDRNEVENKKLETKLEEKENMIMEIIGSEEIKLPEVDFDQIQKLLQESKPNQTINGGNNGIESLSDNSQTNHSQPTAQKITYTKISSQKSPKEKNKGFFDWPWSSKKGNKMDEM